jgi:Tfp pilus assembly protein PilF
VPTVRQAEREYLQAVRLEPENPQAHYEFAMFYERLKFRGRALAELRTALQLNPGYAAARALLAQLSPREAATTLPERP